VQGWQAVNGTVNTNASVSSIRVPVGQTIPATPTTGVRMSGNLPADSSDGTGSTPATVIDSSIDVYNTLGTAVPLRVEYTKVPNSTGTVDWQVDAYDPDGNKIAGPLVLQFDSATGEVKAPAGRKLNITAAELGAMEVDGATPPGSWNGGGIDIDFGLATDADRVTGSSGSNNIAALSQDGAPIGSLVSFAISQEGLISGVFSNGKNEQLGQIALANFTNPAGLEKAGGSLYHGTVNSGNPLIGTAGIGGRGTLSGGAVEMSNVDLAAEFTSLITAQRGFQANARIITASDEILQDLVNMKR
jgi:flagellar hook protein FlgE